MQGDPRASLHTGAGRQRPNDRLGDQPPPGERMRPPTTATARSPTLHARGRLVRVGVTTPVGGRLHHHRVSADRGPAYAGAPTTTADAPPRASRLSRALRLGQRLNRPGSAELYPSLAVAD